MAFKQNNPISRKTSPINRDWIKGAIKRPGAFRKKAEEAGMSTKAFAEKVTSNKEDYSTRTGRQAELAETLMGMSRHEKDHDDKTFTMGELNERSKKQDSLSKKQALKLPQREGLGNPDYEFPEDQRFAGDDGYDDGMSRKSSPHGTYADQGYIKSYKKGNKYVAVDKSEHDSYQDERIASAQALTRARKKARKAKAAKKGVSRKSSGRNPYTNSPVGDLSGDKVYGPATAAISVGKKIYKKGKEFVAGAAKIGKKVKKAVKASKNVTGTGEAPKLRMMKKLTKIKPKKSISRKSSPINKKNIKTKTGFRNIGASDERANQVRELSLNRAMKGRRTMKNRNLKQAGKVSVESAKQGLAESMQTITEKAKPVNIPKPKPKKTPGESVETRARRSVKAPSKEKAGKMSISRKNYKYKK